MPPRSSPVARLLALGLLGGLVHGCSDEPVVAPDGGPGVDLGALSDAGRADATADAGRADAGGLDAEPAFDAGPPPRASRCAAFGLPVRWLRQGDGTYGFGDVAGDFTVRLLDGETWSLSQEWSGCESYLFVGYIGTQGSPSPTEQLWGSPVGPLIESPANAHYFFLSWEATEAARVARVGDMRQRIEAALAAAELAPEAREAQRARFHFVIDPPTSIDGSVGAFLQDYLAYRDAPESAVDLGADRGRAPPPFPFAWGIDRFQTWDPVGSLSNLVGGTFELRMVGYLPGFYDHKTALADRLAGETQVDERVLLDETLTERVLTRTVRLPPADVMATYDTLEVDVGVRCRERNPFACSEWDRIARIDVCLDADCEDRRELVRWITPYWRRGARRWVMDASPLLGLLAAGGDTTFRIEMGPSWERKTPRDARMALRLSRRGKAARATGAVRAFTGGRFDAAYDDGQTPFAFTPPATATRVELVLLLSGHGQTEIDNCAEWCDHRHFFSVNGSPLPEVRHEGRVGSIGGCGARSDEGVPPGQWGNWAPERAFWCPGLPVDPIRIDLTPYVTPGETSTVTYRAGIGRFGAPPPGGSISLSAYVVWHE